MLVTPAGFGHTSRVMGSNRRDVKTKLAALLAVALLAVAGCSGPSAAARTAQSRLVAGDLRGAEAAIEAGLAKDPTRYVVGAGPGASDRLLESSRVKPGGEAVVYAIAPKLAFEYGLIAATIFVAFLLVSIMRGPPLPVLPTSVVFMIFFLSGSLLQPHTVVLAWLLTSIWGKPVTIGVSDALAGALRRQRQSAIPVMSDAVR